jgi:hypothetical protein
MLETPQWGRKMAEHGAKVDLPAHEQTYDRFIGLFKWGAVACFVVAAIVVLIISR